MFCSKCGVQNSDEAEFCEGCSNPFQDEMILPAHLAQRFVHLSVDGFAMIIFGYVIGFVAFIIFGIVFGDVLIGIVFGLIFVMVGSFAYHLVFEAIWQRTIGKMITGTKVVSYDGGKPSFLALLGRTLARYIPFEPLSFLFDGAYSTRGWHDRLSRTLVVPKNLTPEQVRAMDSEKIQTVNSNRRIMEM